MKYAPINFLQALAIAGFIVANCGVNKVARMSGMVLLAIAFVVLIIS